MNPAKLRSMYKPNQRKTWRQAQKPKPNQKKSSKLLKSTIKKLRMSQEGFSCIFWGFSFEKDRRSIAEFLEVLSDVFEKYFK